MKEKESFELMYSYFINPPMKRQKIYENKMLYMKHFYNELTKEKRPL